MEGVGDSNNQRLRELVRRTRLSDAVALTLFNRGLGRQACTSSQWKAYLADPPRDARLPDELLAHAQTQLAREITGSV